MIMTVIHSACLVPLLLVVYFRTTPLAPDPGVFPFPGVVIAEE